jgi:hypothetical protein
MSDKRMIDADELIRAVYDDNDKRTLITIIDFLAQPFEPVKKEAIERLIRKDEQMTEKYIPLEAVKKAIENIIENQRYNPSISAPHYIGHSIILEVFDSLAVPVEDGAIESALLSFSGYAQKSMDTEVWRKLLHKARIELAALRRPVDRQALYQLIKKCGHTSHRSSSHNKGQEWIDTPIDIMLDAIMELTGKKE